MCSARAILEIGKYVNFVGGRQRLKNVVAVGRSLGVMLTSRLAAAAARSAPRVIGECLLSTQSRRSTGENEKCYRF